MAIPEFDVDMDIISKLGDYPGSDNNLTPDGFRKKFDMAGNFIKEYINTILLPHLNQLVDVQSLLDGILDPTLTQPGKAAPAKNVGDVIRNLAMALSIKQANALEKIVYSGDCVLGTDQAFSASMISANEARILGGEAVIQGHVISLNIGSNATVDITPGLYGTYRNDLICARYERDADGKESNHIVIIEGQTNQSGGIDPTYAADNINISGAVVHDIPLYRVRVTNVDITLEKLFTVNDSLASLVAQDVVNMLDRWEGGSY